MMPPRPLSKIKLKRECKAEGRESGRRGRGRPPAPTTIYCDNTGATAIVKNPLDHKRTKHIDTKFYWVCEKVQTDRISAESCHTDEQTADILTKPLARDEAHKTQSDWDLRQPEGECCWESNAQTGTKIPRSQVYVSCIFRYPPGYNCDVVLCCRYYKITKRGIKT
jgi:hypothetical protein